MAAPTSPVQKLQKILANVGPSTHGLSTPLIMLRYAPRCGCIFVDLAARDILFIADGSA